MISTIKNANLFRDFKICSAQVAAMIWCLLVLACNGLTKPGFEGTYVNNAGSEFSVASDTLVVEQVEGNEYRVWRKTGFRLLDEQGKAGKLQYETETWEAVLDEDAEVLREQRYGKMIALAEDGKVLTVGRRKYQRIN